MRLLMYDSDFIDLTCALKEKTEFGYGYEDNDTFDQYVDNEVEPGDVNDGLNDDNDPFQVSGI